MPIIDSSSDHHRAPPSSSSFLQADEDGYRPASAAERIEAENLKRQAALLSGLKLDSSKSAGLGSGSGTGSGSGLGSGSGSGSGAVPSKHHELRRVLMQRVCDVDDNAALATLHLFDTLLQVRVCVCVLVGQRRELSHSLEL